MKEKRPVKTYRDLNVFEQSYSLAMEIFQLSGRFPKEEIYSLINQIRRSTRSIPVNISEGWAKRHYPNLFTRHLVDSIGSCEETKVWLSFAKDCHYVNDAQFQLLMDKYCEVGAMLDSLMRHWKKF
jgi:four helix bundle protein